MRLVTKLLTSALIVGSLGASAYAITDNQPVAAQTIASSGIINELKAKDIALHTTKGDLVADSHMEEDDGIKKYEMTIVKQNRAFDVEIDALTGKVIEYDEEAQFDKENSIPKNVSPNVSLEEAKKTALNYVKGTVTEAEAEEENNRLIYTFEISTANHHEIEVEIDATTGEVLSAELDR